MTKVVYDFIDRPEGPVIDGSEEFLNPEDRVTPADLASPYYGALRDAQKRAGRWPAKRPAHWRPLAPAGTATE